jgi:hypothetical protein
MHKIEAFKQRLRQQSSFGPQFMNQLAGKLDSRIASVKLLDERFPPKSKVVAEVQEEK